MSCKHGNWEPCEECEAEETLKADAYEAGKKSGMRIAKPTTALSTGCMFN
jgi:hypothetical protein